MKDYVHTIMDIVRNESPRLLKQYLLENPSWSLMEKGFTNYTPLIEAVSVERIDMVKFICEYVKSKNPKDKFHSYINQITTDGKNALFIATCMNEKTEIIEYLLEQGVNHTVKDYQNKTVFDYAIFSTSEQVEDFWSRIKINS